MNKPQMLFQAASTLPETGEPNCGLWRWSIPFLLLFVVFADAGCSRPQKHAEDVNWGQPKPRVVRPKPRPEPRSEPAKEGARAAAPTAAEPNGGAGQGPRKGSDPRIDRNGAGNDPAGADESTVGQGKAPGAAGGGPGGASDTPPAAELRQPAPALPGRDAAQPRFSAAQATESAKQLLNRARQLLRSADAAAAAEAAIEAYEQVLPHANSDAECRKLCQQLEEVLDAAGRKSGRVKAVPTRFE
jgi:hypothetical protein